MITDAGRPPPRSGEHAGGSGARLLLLSSDAPDPRALGGVALHAAALADGAAAELPVFTAHPRGGALHVERWAPHALLAAIPFPERGDEDAMSRALSAALAGTGANVLHVHSPRLGPRSIARAAGRAGARLVVTLHDHFLACENYTLLERGVRHCGIPADLARCDACLGATLGRSAGELLRHRDAVRDLVRRADAFVAPSRSVLELCSRAHPEIRERAHRIDWGASSGAASPVARAPRDARLRIAFVGLLSREKGRDRLPSLLSACRDSNVEWHLFGATQGDALRDVLRSAPRVVVHGAYRRDDLSRRLAAAGCHVGFLPSIAAESFSLALSDVLAAGLPAIVSNLGALAERIADGELGWTFDPWAPESLASVVSALAADRTLVGEAAARVRSRAVRTDADMVRDHVRLWRDVAPAGQVAADPAALLLFGEGERRARSPVLSMLLPLVARVRGSLFYQDLRLRRLVSEPRRKAVERGLSRMLSRDRR